MAGYSSTPLVQKLGYKPGMKVLLLDAPDGYSDWLGELPAGLSFISKRPAAIEAAHLFVTKSVALATALPTIRKGIRPDGFVWVSWPKKASKVETDITENTIRDIALPIGFVDVKVCAVSEVWSGLKLVIRKSER